MSDSESDLFPSNVFTFQNANTTVSAKGPNINSANFTNLSFRNNVMTSTMHMSRNFGRQRYREPSFDQRSMYYRRETSPMSLYTGSDIQGRNRSYYHGGMSSQRSMYNGRSGSPISMRSMDSNASVSAVDIALAFKNVKFNKYDLRMIKEAYNKFMKRRIRKKIEKRRNMRLFLKGYRHKSGYDSGEQGSDSSISSDDCKSTTSAMFKDNISSCRSTRTDLTDFRNRIKDSNIYKDCTDNFKQNAMKNFLSVPTANVSDRYAINTQPTSTVQNQQGITQKDRFRNGFLLPSQRFNTLASVPIPERDRLRGSQNTLKPKSHTNYGHLNAQERVNYETDSDQEEIFSEITVREKSTQNYEHQHDKINDQGKRRLEIEENSGSSRKKTKLSSPVKQKTNGSIKDDKGAKLSKKTNAKITKDNNGTRKDNNSNDVKNNNDFEFIKPQLPVRKSVPSKTKEKLISKSAAPLIDTIMPQSNVQITVPAAKTSVCEDKQATAEEQRDETQNSNGDISMRPSFIKRKLFSQKMDVTERKNISTDAINVNSPQTNVYSAIQKEKHKARKLVTNQSCLSRDVVKEDNNLLDLIHKIVPPDRMNVTNVTNKTSISTSLSSKNNPVDEDDKWDVTSVISTCNNDDVSDTYTDEEIFAMDEKKKPSNVKVVKNNNNVQKINNCKILVEKLPKNLMVSTNPVVQINKTIVPQEGNDNLKKSVYNCVKSFWDTDIESDVENSIPKRWTSAVKENQTVVKEKHNKSITVADKTDKNKKTLNMSLASVSESIKSKTMPTNNMGKLKLNISKHLNIKSFLSPKHKKSKVKEQKIEIVNPQKEECPKPSNTETEVKTKQSTKQTATSNPKKIDSNCKNHEVKKSKNSDNINNNKMTQSSNKTKNNKNSPQSPNETNITVKQSSNQNNNKLPQPPNETKNNNKPTKSPNKSKSNSKPPQSSKQNNNKLSQPPNETKNNNPTQSLNKKNNKPTKSPNETKNNNKLIKSPNQAKTKTARPQNACSADKTIPNRSISSRSIRTPKRKACCDALEHENITKPVTKLIGNPCKKPKLAGRSPAKAKNVKKNNDNLTTENHNNKKLETESDLSIVNEKDTSNRILRSRRIDLSSSLNSSTENLTTLKLRSLRTRRVDLSSSLKNSSLDETVIKKSRSKLQAKKSVAKLGYAELLDKRQRR